MKQQIRNNTKGFTGIAILLVVVLLGVAVFLYFSKAGLKKPTTGGSNNNNNTTVVPNNSVVKPKTTEVVKVAFVYTVKSITAKTITINGAKGDFRLPNDPKIITVYKGPSKDSPKLELSQLKVGDALNMEFVPGVSADLFLSVD
jgi:hypothetical protein